tara:strand:- start:120 stop:404 length:285 start_codon:yes stop_codon:yes gene_type:complete
LNLIPKFNQVLVINGGIKMSFFSSASTSNEHKMIDVQYDIEKLQADLEFHQQKIRLINVELEKKQEKLSTLMSRAERLRKMRERLRGDRNETVD